MICKLAVLYPVLLGGEESIIVKEEVAHSYGPLNHWIWGEEGSQVYKSGRF